VHTHTRAPWQTIDGVEFLSEPEVPAGVPLVADFTSTLMSRPVDVSKYGLIYASSGKNLGPSGFVLVIVKDSLLASRWVGAAHAGATRAVAHARWSTHGCIGQSRPCQPCDVPSLPPASPLHRQAQKSHTHTRARPIRTLLNVARFRCVFRL
jgi:hypothetical protein